MMGRMRRDDVSDSFLCITIMSYKKSVLNAYISVAIANGCVFIGGLDGVVWIKPSEKHSYCQESPYLLPNSSNMISIIKIALC